MVWSFFKTVCTAAFIFGWSAQASMLKDTKVSSENYSVDAVLEFDVPVDSKDVKIDFINQTVQIDIPNASVPEGKARKTVQSDKVRSLYTYQLNDRTMRTRIIYEKPIQANMFEGFVHVASVGNQVKIRVEDPESTMSASRLQPKKIQLAPPIDLEAELKPKEFQGKGDKVSAAAVLEDEFLSKIESYSNKIEIGKVPPKTKKKNEAPNETAVTAKAEEEKPASTNGLAESEIPLNLGAKDKKAKVETPWMRLIISFIVISLVGIGTIIFTKKYSRSNQRVGGNIKIQTVSQQSLGPKKSLAVIRVAGEDILIGITDYNISMIKSLSFIDDEVQDVPQNFVSELDKVTDSFIEERTRRQPAPSATQQASADPPEQYSYANIKDIVSDKLKEMRPL